MNKFFGFVFAFVVMLMSLRKGSVLHVHTHTHTLTLVLKEWDVLPREPLWSSQVNQSLMTVQDTGFPVTHSGSKKERVGTM